eukprot:scaffold14714_cov59-Cyclotella_meneghiniana.AAC.2
MQSMCRPGTGEAWRGGVRTPIPKARTATSAVNVSGTDEDDAGLDFVEDDLDLPFSFLGFLIFLTALLAAILSGYYSAMQGICRTAELSGARLSAKLSVGLRGCVGGGG